MSKDTYEPVLLEPIFFTPDDIGEQITKGIEVTRESVEDAFIETKGKVLSRMPPSLVNGLKAVSIGIITDFAANQMMHIAHIDNPVAGMVAGPLAGALFAYGEDLFKGNSGGSAPAAQVAWYGHRHRLQPAY